MTLLVTGGLFQRSLSRARDVDLGFDPGCRSPPHRSICADTTPARRRAFYDDVRRRIEGVPLVAGAAGTSWVPFAILYDTTTAAPSDRVIDDTQLAPMVYQSSVSGGYFETLRMSLVDGRAFDERDDATAAPVAIVNQSLAHTLWGAASVVGRQLKIDAGVVTIVGVVGDGKYSQIWESQAGMVFRPLAQDPPVSATLVVRTTAAPASAGATMAETIRTVDADVAPYDVKTMAEHLDSGSAFLPFRIGAIITGVFGLVGVLLAAIGLYGVVAHQVGRRTQEIGLRMTLGARAADIVRDVLWQGVRLTLAGVTAGVLLTAAASLWLQPYLLDVSALDPATYIGVAVVLLVTSLAASLVPAWRAMRADPAAALRE